MKRAERKKVTVTRLSRQKNERSEFMVSVIKIQWSGFQLDRSLQPQKGGHHFPSSTPCFLPSLPIKITMATRGVVQLKKLIITYCEHSGSSRGVREFLATKVVHWAENHPETQVEVVTRNGYGKHPFIQGEYISKVVQHQVCVKNLEIKDIWDTCSMLANRSGRKITKINNPVLTDTPSCQGIWTPYLNLQQEPPFEVTIQRK